MSFRAVGAASGLTFNLLDAETASAG